MEQKLTGIPETMLIPVWARAVETNKKNGIIHDPKAVEFLSHIDYDFSKFQKAWKSQLGVSVRTLILDQAARDFIQQHPGTVVINLGSGLDTRYERLKELDISFWYDLDVSKGIAFRKLFVNESEKNQFIAKSVFDFSWIDEINEKSHSTLIIAEGLLMYFSQEQVKALFIELAEHFPGAELLFEMLAPFLVGKSKKSDAVGKIQNTAEFKWSLKNSQVIETWDKRIQYIEEWDYYDFCKRRWKLLGLIGRFPLIRPMLSNRIVHLKF